MLAEDRSLNPLAPAGKVPDAETMAKIPSALVQPWPSAGSIGADRRGLLASGEGIYVTDGHGRKLIDGPAGMWCINIGHRRGRRVISIMCSSPRAARPPSRRRCASCSLPTMSAAGRRRS